jgi:hypothetical protein
MTIMRRTIFRRGKIGGADRFKSDHWGSRDGCKDHLITASYDDQAQ